MEEQICKKKVALVTGASRGIGWAVAAALGKRGMRVVCVSRSEETLKSAVDELRGVGIDAAYRVVDVSNSAAIDEAARQLLESYGAIDILVNNAGITRDNLLLRMSDVEWQSVLGTNLSSCFHWTRALLRPMIRNRWGRIINMASVIGLMGNAGQANYAAAKAGVIGFTKSVARELAGRNITANAVAPGFIETTMTAGLSEKLREQARSQIPLGRFGSPADVANVVAFLASDEAAYITGQVIAVDGGMCMGA